MTAAGSCGIAATVARVVTSMLADAPSVRMVAAILRIPPRTLQRRLRSEGLTFAAIVAQARLAAGRRLLLESRCTITEVALDVGYSDHAHFTRAFVRWTGLSPREYRRLARSRTQLSAAGPTRHDEPMAAIGPRE